MTFFARPAGLLMSAIVVTTIACSPTISADTNNVCDLGQKLVNGTCRDYTQMVDMRDFAKRTMDSLNEFARSNDLSTPSRESLHIIMPNDEQTSECPGEPAYTACYQHEKFYIGGAMLFTNYAESNELAPITIIAHEYGHWLQDATGIADDEFGPGSAFTVKQENQADCVSGAYVKWLSAVQRVTLGGLTTLLGMIWQHGSNPYIEPLKVHGEPHERTWAFTTGYDKGLSACNTVGNGSII